MTLSALTRPSVLLLLLSASFASAQDPTSSSHPTHNSAHPTTAPTATAKPSASAHPNDMSSIADQNPGSSGCGGSDPIVYCYIVLIAGFFVALTLLYWVLVTRTKQRAAASRSHSLASWFSGGVVPDETRPRRSRRRWRPSFMAFGAGREEGLNEQGEAPPPYRRSEVDPEMGKPPSYGCAEQFPEELPPRPMSTRSPERSRGPSMVSRRVGS